MLAGNVTGRGAFTGLSYIATHPENGAIDNNTFLWSWNVKVHYERLEKNEKTKLKLRVASAGSGRFAVDRQINGNRTTQTQRN